MMQVSNRDDVWGTGANALSNKKKKATVPLSKIHWRGGRPANSPLVLAVDIISSSTIAVTLNEGYTFPQHLTFIIFDSIRYASLQSTILACLHRFGKCFTCFQDGKIWNFSERIQWWSTLWYQSSIISFWMSTCRAEDSFLHCHNANYNQQRTAVFNRNNWGQNLLWPLNFYSEPFCSLTNPIVELNTTFLSLMKLGVDI